MLPVVLPHTNHQTASPTAIADTGATGHYIDAATEAYCTHVRTTDTGPSVQVANGTFIETTKRACIPLAPALSNHAQVGHIFDHLSSGSLISIGQLCDDDYIALFTKYDVKIVKNGHVIIVGPRSAANGLWTIPLSTHGHSPKPQPPLSEPSLHPSAYSAIRSTRTKHDLAVFLHASAFSPLPSTFLRAIQRGNYTSWPGLTASLITKHLPKLFATSKAHLRMQQKNLRSTKIQPTLPLATSLDVSPSQEPTNVRTQAVFAAIFTATDVGRTKPANSLFNLRAATTMS
jgi:hypothetical protein